MLALLCVFARAESSSTWTLAQSDHFEVFSQANGETARSALIWFEQLRAFFLQAGLDLEDRPPVRVIGFRSAKDYAPYRLRSTSDAYYVGTESRDYIVMPALGVDRFSVASHEYAHLVVHAAGLHLPYWFDEGLAEFFSTIRVGERGCELGSILPARAQVLRRRTWLPLEDLLRLTEKSTLPESRQDSELFYAESWELTEMLVLSSEYRPRFPDLLAALISGTPSKQALAGIYGRSLNAVMNDLRLWGDRRVIEPLELPGVAAGKIAITVSKLSPFASRRMLAEVLLATGELGRAEARYRDLERESPEDANTSAALGTIALSRGDRESARQQWRRAIQEGTDDASLCYRYALLADEGGLSADEIRPALERAIALRPGFDDARYKLALLENNARHYEIALAQFRAMRNVVPARSYAYWSAIAYALDELGRREEARVAAQKAAEHATTSGERANAAQLEYIAQTDVTVQFTRDANGHPQLITTRVPHGTSDWNPFIEPGDHIQRAEGLLRNIECEGNQVTGVTVEAGAERLRLSILDPLHVLMRNAPSEFTCGAQPAASVVVQFAASETPDAVTNGTLRGMEFR